MSVDAVQVRGVWTPDEQRGPTEIRIEAGRIAALRDLPASGDPRAEWLAIPAFANAHVHLDLSAVHGETLDHGSFATWVRELVGRRRAMDTDAVRASIQEGIDELTRHGVAAVGDIDSSGLSAPILESSTLEGVAYREVLGHPSPAAWEELDAWLDAPARRIRRGLSPHAPYSTPESVFAAVLERARRGGHPWSSHVAETLEEREFLQRDTGPIARLFHDWGIASSRWSRPERGVLDRVLDLTGVERCSLVHVNHPEPKELDRLIGASLPVVVCPCSHEYFGHPAPHPVVERAARGGLLLALGTDSRASNDSLNPWSELQCLLRRHPGIEPERAFRWASEGGRAALGLEPASLRPGEPATFQLVRTGIGGALPRWQGFAHGEWETQATMVQGTWVFPPSASS